MCLCTLRVCMSVHVSVYMHVCMSVHVSVYMRVCPHLCVYMCSVYAPI